MQQLQHLFARCKVSSLIQLHQAAAVRVSTPCHPSLLVGLPVKAVVTATALTSTLASLLVGLTANLPVGMSPGMGLNAYLVFSQVLGLHVSIEKALAGCLVAAGVVAVLAVVRALSLILRIVPDSIKLATVSVVLDSICWKSEMTQASKLLALLRLL